MRKSKLSLRFAYKPICILMLILLVTTTMVACSSGEDISIEVPALFTYDVSESQIKSEAKDLGCKNYEINADGSVSYMFSESGQEKAIERLVEKMARADKTRNEIYGDDAEFAVNQDRTRYTLYVEVFEDGFYSFDRLEALSYLYEGAYYQLISGVPVNEVEVTASIIDIATDEVLDTCYFSAWYAWIENNPGDDFYTGAAVDAAFTKPAGNASGNVSSGITEEITDAPTASQNDNIQLNQAFSVGELMEITLNGYEWNDRVLPSDTSGGYTYLDGEEGETYFIVHGTLKSFASGAFDVDYCSEGTITINGRYNFDARMKLESGDHDGFHGSVKPLQTLNLVIFASVSDEVMAIAETVEVNFSIVSDEEALQYFYDDKFPHENYTITFLNGQETSVDGTASGTPISPVCELGIEYQEDNGLYVTLNSLTITEQEGHNSVCISYTVENKTPDTKVLPGSFKLFFTDGTGEPQYGGFDYLFYRETDEREYEWKVLKSQEILALEYNANDDDEGLDGAFFRNQPIDGALHWIP